MKEYYITKSQYDTKKTNGEIEPNVKDHITDDFPKPTGNDNGKCLSVNELGDYLVSDGKVTKWELWNQVDEITQALNDNNIGYIIWEDENGGVHKRLITVINKTLKNGQNGVVIQLNEDEKTNAVKIIHLPINKKVTGMDCLFNSCRKLISVDTKGWDTSNVTSMFQITTDLEPYFKSIDVSGWDTSKVTNMYRCFVAYGKSRNVEKLDVSKWNTSNVTTMDGMFWDCRGLKDIIGLENWNTSNVTNMNGMFRSCERVTTIGDLSNWDTSKVTNMCGMFYSCHFDVNFIESWDTLSVKYLDYILEKTNVTSLDLSGWNTVSLEDIYDKYGTLLTHQPFKNCTKLKTLNVSGWTNGTLTNYSYFFHIPSLTEINLTNFNTSNATKMLNMFYGCNELTNLNLSSFDTSNVTDMGGMFDDCSKLRYITLSKKFFNTTCPIPFNGASNLGFNTDGSPNGWLEYISGNEITPQTGGVTKTICLPSKLYGNSLSTSYIETLTGKGYTIANGAQ